MTEVGPFVPEEVNFAPNDPEYPKNWPDSRKFFIVLLVSGFGFLTPATSSMVAPALDQIATDLHITNSAESQLILSIFLLGLGVGPLLLGPLSEIYGRAPVIRWGNLFYLVFNTAGGFARTNSEMLIFRLLAGVGGSAPLVVGSGVISDCYHPEQRGFAVSIYNIVPLLGPALGPIAGAFITQSISWRWVFFIVSLADVTLQLMAAVVLRETYPPVLLEHRKSLLFESTGNPNLRTPYDNERSRDLRTVLRQSLFRCLQLLVTQPILQVLAIYLAYVYGLIYLVFSTFPSVWETQYHQSSTIGSLNYISLGLGYLSGSLICAVFVDRIYGELKARNDGRTEPEYRVPIMAAASLLVPVGIVLYGWSAGKSLFWLITDIGGFIFSCGIIMIMQSVNNYVLDAYPLYAASAIGAVTVVRNIPGVVFPLFAPYLYDAVGFGWGGSLLALVAVCIGFPAPVIIWIYGRRLRISSQFASNNERE
ncbi:florfenicol exporter, putative [Talaromyces stipitatus ATCC 10500]|uniref:Florfenicol exporter, putative n=1 Tax=Talaromyces stipitatus (strain ATCC 10500 / CBS 375.48 / QM 6759 / NRRL 1006) TaxID=441959 RepID=B8MVJ6_TALSN|nr:florfenicol exporter, putative [Talaromyces stipitatus ATCC 10500]XP_002488834.1 florfenicol exporter, putative [Talaromyces stipitatus ATCC 10500]EED11423.1 florfenicol exporter, putative [Talaromyces stipitatus ATCC 10500]EED11424.1 florfenicol exporter, putative [Talaromyces stipitatus ATCC 10500]